MRKMLALILALTMLLTLAACGGGEEPKETKAPAATGGNEDPILSQGKKRFMDVVPTSYLLWFLQDE